MEKLFLAIGILIIGISTLKAQQIDMVETNLDPEQIKTIWIDTDIAIGRFGKDVDDGIALIMALRSRDVQIKGISVVSNVGYGYRMSKKMLEQYNDTGLKIPVVKGAVDAEDLGENNAAVEAMAEALKKQKMTIIALGPATNIATLLLLHPELKSQIKQIVWCAGRTPAKHFKPSDGKINVCDCNFDHDPKAGQILVASGVDILLSGFEPASDIYLSKEDLLPLKNSRNESDNWIYRQAKQWMRLWKVFLGSEGFIPVDAVTMGSFLYPGLISVKEQVPVVVREQKNDSPLPLSLLSLFKSRKPYLMASRNLTSSNKVDYCDKVRPKLKEVIMNLLLDRQSKEAVKWH